MKTITIANQKGGVGKSTIALHLAHYAILQNLKVLFIDFDAQGNSSSSLLKFEEQPVVASANIFSANFEIKQNYNPQILAGTKALADFDGVLDYFEKNIKLVSAQYDVCIIDTAPTASVMQVAPVMISDYVLSPIELANWSYEGSMPFLQMLSSIRNKRKTDKPKFLGLLPSRVWTNSPKQKADYQKLIENDSFRSNLFRDGEFVIPMKQCYMESGDTGKPIWSFRNKSSARAEGVNMKSICHAVLQDMSVINQ